MANSGMDVGFDMDDSTGGEKEDGGIDKLPIAEARDAVSEEEEMLHSQEGGPADTVQSVLVINICNDVFYSVAVESLNPENKYTHFCFGPHVVSFCTKDNIPLVVYNNSDDQTLSLDDVTLANVLSKNPCPMTGPLFYRKSKAEFKELTENETVGFMVNSIESCSGGNSHVEGMEVDAAGDPPPSAGAVEGSAGPGNELIGNDEIMNYLRSKDVTSLLSLDSNEFRLIESTLSTEQAIDILGPSVMNLYGESSHVHSSALRRETGDSSPLSAREYVECVLQDHSYATSTPPPQVELLTDLPSPVAAAALGPPGAPASPQTRSPHRFAPPPHRFATPPLRSSQPWSQAATAKSAEECKEEIAKQSEPEAVCSQQSPASSLHVGGDSLELTQKQRAKGWVGELPSPTAQLSGNGSPLVMKANGRPRQNLTEEMIDEKLSQELPDNDDYKFSSEDASKEDPFEEEDPLSKWVGASPPDTKNYYRRSPSRVTEESVSIARDEKKQRKRSRVASNHQQDECSPRKNTKKPGTKVTAKLSVPARHTVDAKKARKAVGATKVAELKVETVAKENAVAPGKDGKAPPPLGATKSYPKRENRRPPGRLQDALQPALFSTPDVIRRYSTETKPAAPAGLTDEYINKLQIVSEPSDSDGNGKSVELGEEDEPPSQPASQPLPTLIQTKEGDTKTEVKAAVARPASPEVKVSKRIRKKKQIFTELEDPKPSQRAQKGKPKPTVKGGRAGVVAKGKEKEGVEGNAETDLNNSDSGSMKSEDDPDKLWCICRKPHNNRFMICCDSCAEWFHGLCVNIPRALGKAIEKAGNEWTCPACLELAEKEEPPVRKVAKEAAKVPVKKSTPAVVSPGKKPPAKHAQNLLGALVNKKSKVSPKSKPQKTRCGEKS